MAETKAIKTGCQYRGYSQKGEAERCQKTLGTEASKYEVTLVPGSVRMGKALYQLQMKTPSFNLFTAMANLFRR